MIDKKIKYAIQGGGPNYLGKQKMVKAPKKWKSSPDHPDTELAYITEPEKQVLIALNLHGGLEDGKPNRGPSGIISLQGDMGSIGGGTSGGNGGGGGDAREQYIAQQYTAPPAPTRDPDPVTEVVPGDVTPKKTYTPEYKGLHDWSDDPDYKEKLDYEEPYEMVAGVEVPLSMRGVKGVDPREDPERYFEKPGVDPFEVPESERTIEDKLAIEDWEKKQDWDLIQEMSDKGYDFEEIQDAIEKGLAVKAPTDRRQSLIDFGLRSIIPETSLEKSLLNRMKSFVPGAQTGISSLTDKMGSLGRYFNPQKMITSFALNKMGLGFLNPILGIASLFGFKNPLANIGTRYTLPTKKGPDVPTEKDGPSQPENVMEASIKKFQPTQNQMMQIAEIQRKRDILQSYADQKGLNEKGMNTLAQMNQLINQYQADPRSIYG